MQQCIIIWSIDQLILIHYDSPIWISRLSLWTVCGTTYSHWTTCSFLKSIQLLHHGLSHFDQAWFTSSLRPSSSFPPVHRVSRGHQRHQKWPPALPAHQPVDLGFTDSTKGELRWREVDDWYPQGSKKVDRNNTKTYDEKEWNCLGYSTFGRVRDTGWGRKPK